MLHPQSLSPLSPLSSHCQSLCPSGYLMHRYVVPPTFVSPQPAHRRGLRTLFRPCPQGRLWGSLIGSEPRVGVNRVKEGWALADISWGSLDSTL
ncbi:hypothetical protein LEMLEM_LOCUS19044 [Lemmus lemmus]